MGKNQVSDIETSESKKTGTVHTATQAGGRQAGQGMPGSSSGGQDTWHPPSRLWRTGRAWADKVQLKAAGDKPVSPEHIELTKLRAQNARLRMERDILGKAMANSSRVSK